MFGGGGGFATFVRLIGNNFHLMLNTLNKLFVNFFFTKIEKQIMPYF